MKATLKTFHNSIHYFENIDSDYATTYYGSGMYEDLVVHMYSWADFSFIPMLLTYITYCRDIYHLSAVFLYVMLKLGKCTV